MLNELLKITIFGVGCTKYKAFSAQVQSALEDLKMNAVIDSSVVQIEEVEDVDSFVNNGIIHIPAIAVNGEVVTNGQVPSVELLKKAIMRIMNYEL